MPTETATPTSARMLDLDKPLYTISVAAEILASHPRTLMMYEAMGLGVPERTATNRRRYSQRDILTLAPSSVSPASTASTSPAPATSSNASNSSTLTPSPGLPSSPASTSSTSGSDPAGVTFLQRHCNDRGAGLFSPAFPSERPN